MVSEHSDRLRQAIAAAGEVSRDVARPAAQLPTRVLNRDLAVYRTKLQGTGAVSLPVPVREAWAVGGGDHVRWIDLGYAVVVVKDDDELGDRMLVELRGRLLALDEQRRAAEQQRRADRDAQSDGNPRVAGSSPR